ncbi:hypothetical protein GJ496_002036 [Pomphorhynchus laevis]|nr:hypothetical protein GJ496_002036 [Pomphorhynchus laevis]
MSWLSNTLGNNVKDKSGNVVDLQNSCRGKKIYLYFSAKFCGPCKANFEVIFVSMDISIDQAVEYYKTMPFWRLSFQSTSLKDSLVSKFSVASIPALIVINADTGNIISMDAKKQIQFSMESITRTTSTQSIDHHRVSDLRKQTFNRSNSAETFTANQNQK